MAKHKKSDLCPICGQFMELYCAAHRNKPFVDDQCYPRICFGCFWVPKTMEQIYNEDGSILEEKQLEYSHRSLHTPDELFQQGTCETLKEARLCVRSVKNACKAAGLDGRKKPKPKKRPKDPETGLID